MFHRICHSLLFIFLKIGNRLFLSHDLHDVRINTPQGSDGIDQFSPVCQYCLYIIVSFSALALPSFQKFIQRALDLPEIMKRL